MTNERLAAAIRDAFEKRHIPSPGLEARVVWSIPQGTRPHRSAYVPRLAGAFAAALAVVVVAVLVAPYVHITRQPFSGTATPARVSTPTPPQTTAPCVASGSPDLYRGPRPQTHNVASVAFDAARHEMVMLSEVQPGVLQTWVWSGAAWAQKHPVTSPDALLGMAFDSAESRIIGFGTKADLQQAGLEELPLGETWTWDGTNWKQESPRTSPPARRQASLVYDSKRERVLMMGGYGRPNESFKDVWAWSGGNWQPSVPAPDLYVSVPADVAYDVQHDQLVRYWFPGGYDSAPRVMWLFDGAAWRSVPVGPGDLPYGGALGYDGRLGKLVMFGEQFSPSGAYRQVGPATWTWDGKTWTKVCAGGGPAGRFYPLMTYDSSRDRLILLGGYTLPTTQTPLVWPNDLWEFDGRQWMQRA